MQFSSPSGYYETAPNGVAAAGIGTVYAQGLGSLDVEAKRCAECMSEGWTTAAYSHLGRERPGVDAGGPHDGALEPAVYSTTMFKATGLLAEPWCAMVKMKRARVGLYYLDVPRFAFTSQGRRCSLGQCIIRKRQEIDGQQGTGNQITTLQNAQHWG